MAEIQETAVIALSPRASFQSLGLSAVILMTDSGQLYTCNETTEALLRRVDGILSLAEIIDDAFTEFEIDRETLRGDFLALAAELVAEGIVTTV